MTCITAGTLVGLASLKDAFNPLYQLNHHEDWKFYVSFEMNPPNFDHLLGPFGHCSHVAQTLIDFVIYSRVHTTT